MTTDLEKRFFSTFGIEPFIYCSKPRLDCDARSKGTCRKDCEYYSGVLYPQITDSIYLNLILIMNPYAPPVGDTMEEMKSQILYWCIQLNKEIKHQVRTLFKEVE